jgi:hypothetical protein
MRPTGTPISMSNDSADDGVGSEGPRPANHARTGSPT